MVKHAIGRYDQDTGSLIFIGRRGEDQYRQWDKVGNAFLEEALDELAELGWRLVTSFPSAKTGTLFAEGTSFKSRTDSSGEITFIFVKESE